MKICEALKDSDGNHELRDDKELIINQVIENHVNILKFKRIYKWEDFKSKKTCFF